MLERDIEAHLVKVCKKYNILCEKFTSPQRRSVPDRVLTHDSEVIFLELKATGKKPTEAQYRDHYRRAEAGATVCWTDSTDGVDVVVQHMLYGCSMPRDITRKVLPLGD